MKSFRRIISIILTITVLVTTSLGFSACSKSDNAEGKMLVSDYLVKVIDDFNMNPDSEETTPDTALEIAKEWRVIDNNDINLKKPVTEGFVLVTLVKTVGFYDVDSLDKYEIADYAVENNYNGFKYKDKKDFNKCPSKAEVIDSINKAKSIWLNPHFEKTSDIEYKDDVADLSDYSFDQTSTSDLAPVKAKASSSNNDSNKSFDDSSDILTDNFKRKQVVINGKADIEKGQTYVSPTVGTDAANEMYVAEKVEYIDGKTYITNSDESVDLEMALVQASGSDSGIVDDLTSRPIVDGDGNVHYPEDYEVEPTLNNLQNVSPTYMSYDPNSTYDIQNVKKKNSKQMKFSVNFGTLSAEVVVKNNSFKCKVTGTVYSKEKKTETLDFNSENVKSSKNEVKVNKAVEIKDISYDYNYNIFKKNAYLVVSSTKVDTTGISIGKDNKSETKITPDGINSALNEAKFLKSKTLASIPLATAGPVSINLVIKLKLSISGGVEIVVTTKSQYGLDVKNGNIRIVKDEKKSKDITVNAKIEATVYFGPALCVGGVNVVSCGFEVGAGAEFKMTLHVVDVEKNFELYSENFGIDVSGNMSVAENIKCDVCSDLNVYWIMKFTIDGDCLLAKWFKISYSKDILNKDNASFVKAHFEDGKKVKKCTRKYTGKEEATTESNKPQKDSIELSAFSITINEGGQGTINVTALPTGYKSSDLIYQSDDTSVVTVSNSGIVKGVSSGTAIVSVYTKDKKYQTSIAVSVIKKLSVPYYQSEYEVKNI